MTVNKDILNFFETFAPTDTAMDFDNVGLLVGSNSALVTKALVTLDITDKVVLEAEKTGCELIISHHPVIFKPIKNLDMASVPYLLASKGISAVCMHTNLDLSQDFGVNTCLAKAIGVKNPELCGIGECMFTGELENEININLFAQNVKSALNCSGLRYTDIKINVKKVAVSSGSGGSNIYYAAELGADVLVTGEIKHHEINSANALGVNIIDTGHFKSEDVVILPLINKLSKKFPDIEFTKSKTYNDFIKYI